MAVIVEYRTESVEQFSSPDYWYEGDNEQFYASMEEALQYSQTILDWRDGQPSDLTVVRVRNVETGKVTYISPNPVK